MRGSSGRPIGTSASSAPRTARDRAVPQDSSARTGRRPIASRRLARWIAADVFKRPDQADAAARAGRLAKADLATDMVREFTELQGAMGGVYAREAGEPEAVWKAAYHQYLPIAVEPTAAPAAAVLGAAGVTWAAVSLADKLDTLVGLFLAQERPTGSRDPFGLRRQAHGILRILLDVETLAGVEARPSLGELVDAARAGYGEAVPASAENGPRLGSSCASGSSTCFSSAAPTRATCAR
jgi:hypothetical protein